jgi:TolB-like protein
MEIIATFQAEEINLQTRKILNFSMFRNSPILSRFLEFVVGETIHNRELQIKEYSIAIHVLHRARDFNPNVDSIVRIHAGRLRRALNEYYLTEGIYDTLIIKIPKGGYVPEFTDGGSFFPASHQTAATIEPETKPRVAIFPFRVAGKNENLKDFLLQMEEQLSEELLSFHDVSVTGYYSSDMKARIAENILEAGKLVNADYIISGSITKTDNNIRMVINLLVTATGEVLLCRSFERENLSTDIINVIINISGDSYDIIFQDWRKNRLKNYRSLDK